MAGSMTRRVAASLGETAETMFDLIAWDFDLGVELGCLRRTRTHECLWTRSSRRPAKAA